MVEDIKTSAAIESEQLLLASVFVSPDNETMRQIREILKPQDFFLLCHSRLYETMLAMFENKEPIDYVSVMEALSREEGRLESCGGIAYINDLATHYPRTANVKIAWYCNRVKETRIQRQLRHLAERVAQDASLTAPQVYSLLSRGLEQAAADLSEANVEEKSYLDAYREGFLSLDANPTRVFSDIPALDALTGGFLPGELIVFTAETGVGKSIFAAQTRRRACKDGLVCLYCSGEMLAGQLSLRELAAEANVKPGKMRFPNTITQGEASAMAIAATKGCPRCQILDTTMSIERIARAARRIKAKDRLDLVVIDYDELVEAEGETDLDQQKNVVKFCKTLAIQHGCVVILVSQLRKAIDSRDRARPSIQRIYGTGAKSKHPSVILYVDRPFQRELKGRETDASIAVLKNRNGACGVVPCRFNLDTLRFEESEK